MSQSYTGSAPPLPCAKFQVIRVTTAESQQFVCLSNVPYGQWVHWFGRRSHECVDDRGATCSHCRDNWPRKWKAYLHVLTADRQQQFLEITAPAFRALETQMHDRTMWRGAIFQIRRTKGGPHGRYVCHVLERRVAEDELPEARDVLETLRMLWRAKKGPSQNS